jgi:hypothetical protein
LLDTSNEVINLCRKNDVLLIPPTMLLLERSLLEQSKEENIVVRILVVSLDFSECVLTAPVARTNFQYRFLGPDFLLIRPSHQ